jgi:predicted transposase
MKLVAQVRLYPTDEQKSSLLQTLESANAVCNRISSYAWDNRIFRQYDLHHALYHTLKKETGLAAQMVVRCTAKVADAYKLGKKTQRTFKPRGSIAYDDRILSWEYDNQTVSIWTVDGRTTGTPGGRQRMTYGAGERQRHYLKYRQGETDLVHFNGMFFLLSVCDIPDPDEQDVEGALGVDLGVINIAATSDGDVHTSETIEKNRCKQQRLRSELQQVGTRSAKRKLKKLSGRQARFQKDINHQISKRIVTEAERTKRTIALEDLKGIRQRTRARGKEQRAKHSN